MQVHQGMCFLGLVRLQQSVPFISWPRTPEGRLQQQQDMLMCDGEHVQCWVMLLSVCARDVLRLGHVTDEQRGPKKGDS